MHLVLDHSIFTIKHRLNHETTRHMMHSCEFYLLQVIFIIFFHPSFLYFILELCRKESVAR